MGSTIDAIWKSQHENSSNVEPPKPNQYGSIPYNKVVYHIDHLDNLFMGTVVDQELAGFIQRKSPAFSDDRIEREKVVIHLMDHQGDVFDIEIWIVPVFLDGVLAAQLYAADDFNLERIKVRRSPVEQPTNEYSVL